jgi:type IV pilus assembly protein PilC
MEFLVRVGTPEGRVMEQIHHARDEVTLKGELVKKGLHVFAMHKKGWAWGLPSLRGRRRRIAPATFLVFNQELAALLKAGLPLLQGLELMLERQRDPQLRTVLTDIRDRIKSGQDLSDAFAVYGDVFPPLYASSLKAGERTGELEQVIRRFIRYQKLMLEARKKVVSALVYPAVLVFLSIAMIVLMTVVVVPKFTAFFKDLDVELPLMTRLTLALSDFLIGNWLWIVPTLVVAVTAIRRWLLTDSGRLAKDSYLLRIPIAGGIAKRFALGEFTRSLSTLLAGGIPLVSALEIAVSAVGNLRIRGTLGPTTQQVREGKPFFGALESTELFEAIEVDMVKVGEATGSLDTMLGSVAEFLDEQIEARLSRVLTLIEPLMLVFMGVIVALLLVSIYVPLFNSLGKIQG